MEGRGLVKVLWWHLEYKQLALVHCAHSAAEYLEHWSTHQQNLYAKDLMSHLQKSSRGQSQSHSRSLSRFQKEFGWFGRIQVRMSMWFHWTAWGYESKEREFIGSTIGLAWRDREDDLKIFLPTCCCDEVITSSHHWSPGNIMNWSGVTIQNTFLRWDDVRRRGREEQEYEVSTCTHLLPSCVQTEAKQV